MAARKRKLNRQEKKKQTVAGDKHVAQEDIGHHQIYATLGGAFLFSCVCTAIIWMVFIRERHVQFLPIIKQIEMMRLASPDAPFAKEAIEMGKPLLIKNSITTKWKALGAWSPKYLQLKISQFNGVYQNDNRWFGPYYDTSKPLSPYTSHPNPYHTNVTLTSKEFFARIQQPSIGRYHYYTGDMEQLGEWAWSDVSPLHELLSPNPAHSSINVWMGQPHVIAHCHYDGYHNFYAQLYGTKKFTLFSPREWPSLYPYPFLHPSHAQAQPNISRPNQVKLFPLLEHVEAYEVTLVPGDLLYMPPLWFHHVESMDVSISINVWTDSHQTSLMQQVFDLRIPYLEIQWRGDHLKAIGASVVIYRAVESICDSMKCPLNDKYDSGSSFKSGGHYLMYKLWQARYANLMKDGVILSNFTQVKRHRKSLLCEGDPLPLLFYQGIAQQLDGTDIDGFIKQLTQLIEGLPKDTWEVWFGNYIEYLIAQAVDLLHVGVFLQYYDTCIKYFL
jgi:hypothetical protein